MCDSGTTLLLHRSVLGHLSTVLHRLDWATSSAFKNTEGKKVLHFHNLLRFPWKYHAFVGSSFANSTPAGHHVMWTLKTFGKQLTIFHALSLPNNPNTPPWHDIFNKKSTFWLTMWEKYFAIMDLAHSELRLDDFHDRCNLRRKGLHSFR